MIVGSNSQPNFIQLDIIDTRQIDKQHSIEIKVPEEQDYFQTYHVNLDGQLYHMVISYYFKEPKQRVDIDGFSYIDGTIGPID